MEFHTSKCQVISIPDKVKPIIGKYQIHDHILEQVNCAKYLGIYIDSKLATGTHVDVIVKKANSTRAILARNIPQCCRKVKQMAYATNCGICFTSVGSTHLTQHQQNRNGSTQVCPLCYWKL